MCISQIDPLIAEALISVASAIGGLIITVLVIATGVSIGVRSGLKRSAPKLTQAVLREIRRDSMNRLD